MKVLEKGSAEIRLELKKGFITVYHIEYNTVLAKWKANKNDWHKIWLTIDRLEQKGKYRKCKTIKRN